MVGSDVTEYSSIIISETTAIFSFLVAHSFGLPLVLRVRQRKHEFYFREYNFLSNIMTLYQFLLTILKLLVSISSFLRYPQANATEAREILVISFPY